MILHGGRGKTYSEDGKEVYTKKQMRSQQRNSPAIR